ncbi:MAG TPA: hypothetical protein VNN22_19700 [Verrucomicrobiae bacterium]|nr:hypothetical protein [Verrucomicrobiae bacterium]
MKRVGTIAVCLVGGLTLGSSLRADDVVLPGNPYAVVVTRNIFGLNPPPVVDPNATVVEPPVKIVPNGIMSIFGQLQVLFKVAAKPGGKDAAYMLTEGQRQDDIEVVRINEKAAIVTFNNHGIVQDLPLVVTPPSSTPSVPTGGPAAGLGGAAGNNPFNSRFGNRGTPATRGGTSGGGNNPGADNGSGPRNVPTRASAIIERPQSNLTTEEATIAMEVNRELTKQQVMEGSLPPIPPTEITPSDATGPGGGPLVTPTPGAPGAPP